MKKITSKDNPEIKDVVKLLDKKGREKSNRFLAEGLRTVSALIESGITIEKLYVTEKNIPLIQDLNIKIKDMNNVTKQITPTIVDDAVLSKISFTQSPSGIIAVFNTPQEMSPKNIENSIILSGIQDPGNLGTLIRTAVATGFEQIFFVDTCEIWNPKVVQASAGTIGLLKLHNVKWAELQKIKGKKEFCALVVNNGKPEKDINFKDVAIVVGSEAHGIPENQLKDCKEKLTLKMQSDVESLNAAVAGSIAMYLAKIN